MEKADINKIEFFNNNALKLLIPSAIAAGMAYAGRIYVQINPLHAALFTVGTLVTTHLGRKLAEFMTDREFFQTKTGRTIYFISSYTIAALTIGLKVFTPLQAITALGLTAISSNLYNITGCSPWLLS